MANEWLMSGQWWSLYKVNATTFRPVYHGSDVRRAPAPRGRFHALFFLQFGCSSSFRLLTASGYEAFPQMLCSSLSPLRCTCRRIRVNPARTFFQKRGSDYSLRCFGFGGCDSKTKVRRRSLERKWHPWRSALAPEQLQQKLCRVQQNICPLQSVREFVLPLMSHSQATRKPLISHT